MGSGILVWPSIPPRCLSPHGCVKCPQGFVFGWPYVCLCLFPMPLHPLVSRVVPGWIHTSWMERFHPGVCRLSGGFWSSSHHTPSNAPLLGWSTSCGFLPSFPLSVWVRPSVSPFNPDGSSGCPPFYPPPSSFGVGTPGPSLEGKGRSRSRYGPPSPKGGGSNPDPVPSPPIQPSVRPRVQPGC